MVHDKARNWARYEPKEVEALLTGYIDLQGSRSKDFFEVRMMDLHVAMRKLPQYYRQILFYYGVAGKTSRDTGDLMGISHTTVMKHYQEGLGMLSVKING